MHGTAKMFFNRFELVNMFVSMGDSFFLCYIHRYKAAFYLGSKMAVLPDGSTKVYAFGGLWNKKYGADILMLKC